jgi:hypothetical protein
MWFMSQYGVHSLAATEAYGDFQGAYLTRFLRSYFRSSINRAGLARVWGVNYDEKGCGLWVIAGAGSATNNRTFGLSYARIEEEGLKPFEWTRGGASAGIRINPSSALREVVFGGTTGFVTLEDQPSRSLASGAAYSLRGTTPKIFFAEQDEGGRPRPYGVGTPCRLGLRSVSTGDWDVTISVQRDNIGSTLHTFNQGADLTTVSGFTLGSSALGSDSLGGGAVAGGPQIAFATDLGGTCRTVQFDITQGGFNEDAHLSELVLDWTPEAFSTASNVETTDQ